MQNFEKVIALYEYTKKLVELKYKVESDIKRQLFSLLLNGVPQYKNFVEYSFRDFAEVDDEGDGESEVPTLLRVQKPDFQSCPKPSESLMPWLIDGWSNYKNDAKHEVERRIDGEKSATEKKVATQKILTSEFSQPELDFFVDKELKTEENEVDIERFDDDIERVSEFEKWKAERDKWVADQRAIESIRNLFTQLFNVYTDLNREAETQELMIGNGFLKVAGNPQINHPILLKRVAIKLDAKDNVITIHDEDSTPELYTLLLSSIGNDIIDHSIIKISQEELAQQFYHPFDRNNASDFMKMFTHRLSSNSAFTGYGDEKRVTTSEIQVSMNEPVFFVRKKIDGTLKTLDTIIETVKNTQAVPQHILELVSGGIVEVPDDIREITIEEKLAYANGENPEILLSKPANREQLEIAERIERYNAVLVQGPPGTGKTHTIANLIGHFLSQGKSVLVTSHTAKALSVIQEKLPQAIQHLCVTVNSNDNNGMVRSIDGISDFMARHTSSEMNQRAEDTGLKRKAILKQLDDIRRKLYQIRFSEFKPIVFGGNEYSPKEAAEFVRLNNEELSYIPGKVKLYQTMPVTVDDLLFLYKSNGLITSSDETELATNLPNPEILPTVAEFQALCDDFGVANKEILQPQNIDELVGVPNIDKINTIINDYIKPLEGVESWIAYVVADGNRGGGYRQRWEKLCDLINKASDFLANNIELLMGKDVSLDDVVTLAMICNNADKLCSSFAKGKPSSLSLLFSKEVKAISNGVKINNQPLASMQDCKTAIAYAESELLRTEIAPLWNELLSKKGVADFRSLGNEPESIAQRFIADIKTNLDWSKNNLATFRVAVENTGLSYDLVFPENRMATEDEKFITLFDSMLNKLPRLLEVVRNHAEYEDKVQARKNLLNASLANQAAIQDNLRGATLGASPVCNNLNKAVTSLDVNLYKEQHRILCELYNKYDTVTRRCEILSIIRQSAPNWAEAIENREGAHGAVTCPNNVDDAWKWKQFAGIIDELTEKPFEALQRDNALLSGKLREITAELVAYKAWFHLLKSTEANLTMRQALQGWKMTVRKIGKGTGKNAPMYRRQAMEQMSICQNAVPAWIMPINKAMDTLNPAVNNFDVIIVDEASQCDLSSIGVLYMAKKIIIVGDDKQVSPLAVGMDMDKINALRDMYVKDIIPNWHLYESKTSLYDIAQTTFQPLMLREHFRCLPEIIGYSNKLSYDYKIKPLRDSGTAKILPSVVSYRVADGMRDGRSKKNTKEAEAIIALMRSCMEQPEYDGMTFGVISLLGDIQAGYIQNQIIEQLPPHMIEERQILCGNASHFQGDERDVMFLSLVDSNEGDGLLRMTGEGVDASTKQRYNVAASRAKEQLWVIHSLDYSKDLKSGDMRRDLIEYVSNPKSFQQIADSVEKKSESPFEEAVGKTLVAHGYNLEQQYEVGAYRLDMVVSYGMKKVAVECDGEAWHGSESQIQNDMERQSILERIGWRFVRIRGSEYYRDPEKTMVRVIAELSELGISPEAHRAADSEQNISELLERVKIRASQIITSENEDNIFEDFAVGGVYSG